MRRGFFRGEPSNLEERTLFDKQESDILRLIFDAKRILRIDYTPESYDNKVAKISEELESYNGLYKRLFNRMYNNLESSHKVMLGYDQPPRPVVRK